MLRLLSNNNKTKMFDNICKYLAQNFQDDFANWLLGNPVKLTELKPTELSNDPIRADSLIFLQSEDLVLHIEFQTVPDEEIPFRMLDYRGRVYRKYPHKQMRQVVIYLRKTSSELVYETSFRLDKTYHEFEVIRLWEKNPREFLNNLGLLPFAVLSKTENPIIVLTEVAQIIEANSDKTSKANLIASSAILAGLVLKPNMIQRILRSDIMRESSMYQEILKEGELRGQLKGKLEGELKGKLEGELKGKLEVAKNLLQRGMSLIEVVSLTNLPQESIENLANDFFDN